MLELRKGEGMKRFRALGLLLAVIAVAVYVVVAAQKGRAPELSCAIVVLLGVFGLQGAVRLFGIALTGQLDKIAEDPGLLVIGGIALAWVSIQTIFEVFSK